MYKPWIPYRNLLVNLFLLLTICGWMVGCSMLPVDPMTPTDTSPPAKPSFPPSPSVTITSTSTATSTLTPAAATPTPAARICSPLENYSQAELIEAVSNPFRPPRWGSDDPHQAVDLAVLSYGMALAGDPVQAVLDGVAAAVVSERFPYGNALLIETRLDALPDAWRQAFQLPTPAPTLGPHPSLTCPQTGEPLTWKDGPRSLYLLYAHLQEPPDFSLEDGIECGAQIGLIGQSGNALNPHLHLEARVGPSGVRFNSMAHYSGGISLEEMRNYCAWRVSGVFQLVDPLLVLSPLP